MAIEDADMADVEKYTVPLLIPNVETGKGSATGVLVKVDDNYFIFTAGHCVDDWNKTKEGEVIKLWLSGAVVPFTALRTGFVKEGAYKAKDFGFFMLPHEGVSVITTQEKLFLPEERLQTSAPEPYEPVFISGYPGTRDGISQLYYMTFRGNVHPQIDTRYPERFTVLVSREELEKVATPNNSWLEANSQGISGGGCWIMRDIGGQLLPCLVATHYSSDDTGTKKLEAQLENHMKIIREALGAVV